MIRRPFTWPAGVLLVAALLAGCGGGSSTSSTTTAATSQSTPAPATTTPAAATPATTTPTGGTSAVATPQAIETCKRQIHSTQTLSANVKSKLEAVCVKAAHGDKAAVKQVGREVCEEIINRSPLPAGVTKDKALAACRK